MANYTWKTAQHSTTRWEETGLSSATVVAQPYSVCHIGDASVITVQLSMFVSRHLCTQWVNCKWCVVSNKAKRLSHRHIGCKNLSSADDPMTANQWETPCTRDNRQEVVATANKAQRTYGSSCPYEKKKRLHQGLQNNCNRPGQYQV